MNPVVVTQTGAGTSVPVALDYFKDVFNVGLYAVATGGTPTFNIELTPQDPMDGTPTVWEAPAALTAITATNGVYDLTTPGRALRINITTGPGTVTLYVVQAGTR